MKNKNKKFNSGISPTTNLSYEKYLTSGLEIISPRLSVRVYKLAPKEEFPIFERGKDLRVKIFWDKEPKHEFIVEVPFWIQSNTNKLDREWMRNHADITLAFFKDALIKKSKKKKKANKKGVKNHKHLNSKIGSTQEAFEKMKVA